MAAPIPDPISSLNPSITAARIEAFCRAWKVRELSVFGSVLRSDFRPESDVDVLLVFEDGASPALEESIDMRDELRSMFGRDVDVVEKWRLKNPFRRHHILTTRRVLYAA